MTILCKGICTRFLAQLRKNRSGIYYYYNRRVMKNPGWIGALDKYDYRRCAHCEIILRGFESCPCCGNVHLSLKPYSRHKDSKLRVKVKRI